jgi:hypothetical protein
MSRLSIMRLGSDAGLFTVAPLRRQRGQALILGIFISVLVILAMFAMYSIGNQSVEKVRLQNNADAAAYSAAVAEARDYNYSAYTNRAMIANQVAVAQFVGLTSWFRNMSSFANGDKTNAGRVMYDVFFAIPSPLGNFYKKFLKVFGRVTGIFDDGKAGSSFMSFAVTALDALIKVYGESQRVYHYATAVSVAETLGAFSTIGGAMADLTGVNWFSNLSALDGGDSIIAANDDIPECQSSNAKYDKAKCAVNQAKLSVAGVPYLAYHYYKWFNFTQFKDPNTTSGGDGSDVGANTLADRFATVTMDSLDDFSRDRSTKPAWGFNFFYAPPLTFIDPTRFIPYQNGPLFLPVIHRGGTELKLTKADGTGGTASSGGGAGNGYDCHGNPVTGSTTSSAGSITVNHYSDLAAHSAVACDGTSGMVTIGDSGHPKGIYSYRAGSWIDPSTLTNTAGSASGRTTSGSSGGVPGDMAKKSWTALDATSWAGLDLIWIVIPIIFIPIPLPIPFAPPWIPLAHGAALSGAQLPNNTVLASDNNFGVPTSKAYGEALNSWMTKAPAEMRRSKGAGTTLDKFGLGGLTKYMDVKDVAADNLTGPPLVIEVEKAIDGIPTSPGTGQFALENGAPKGLVSKTRTMRSLAKSQVYFSRPKDDAVLTWFNRADGKTELGSLYNPYWQPRLLPNTFLEQYLSMELHRAGIP